MGLVPSVLSAEDLGAVLDAMREGLQVLSHDWRYLYLNETAARHGQRDRAELLGTTLLEAYPGVEDTEMFAFLCRCRDEGRAGTMENRFHFPDGSTGVFELRAEPIQEGLVVLSLDVSSRKRVEEQLRHSQKMEALGRLAGGVAHDFNNLLTVVQGSASFALDQGLQGEELAEELQQILTAVDRAVVLTRQLLTLSRSAPTNPTAVDLTRVLLDADRMLGRVLGEDIERVVIPQAGVWKTWIDRDALDQVLLNLVLNARDAMPEGGRLTLETRNVALDEDEAIGTRHVAVPAGDYVMLSVSDNGVGMRPDVLDRVFEPFFTTKRDKGGTGLGLSTSFGIVQQAGGYMWPYSEVGVGTTFRVYLPRTVREAPSRPVAAQVGDLAGTESILLVEDDAGVLHLAKRALTRYGYVVHGCRDGEEALAALTGPERVDVLVTDLVLPARNGVELAAAARALRPGLRVVFVSGYTEHVVAERLRREPDAIVLEKPFTGAALAQRVRAALVR